MIVSSIEIIFACRSASTQLSSLFLAWAIAHKKGDQERDLWALYQVYSWTK